MSTELLLFCGLAVLLALFQTAMAQPVRGSVTMYKLMDRPSWLIGGALAIAIAVWRPWFTTAWWKALFAAPILVIFMASVAQIFIERVLTFGAVESQARRIAKLLSSVIVIALLFFGFRACG
jgi:hypothetical protein